MAGVFQIKCPTNSFPTRGTGMQPYYHFRFKKKLTKLYFGKIFKAMKISMMVCFNSFKFEGM